MSESISRPRASGESKPLSLPLPRLRIKHLWLSLPALLLAWISFMHPLPKLDFWWHLKTGEVIVASGHIPRIDLFSFTQTGESFMYQNWLGEVIYYLTYQAGGFPLLIAFNTVMLLLALVPIYRLCLEAASNMRVAMLCAVLAALVLGLYSHMRPQTYSFALFGIFYWVLWGYREGRRDYLWALPALMALWVNLHGAFVLGIGLIGLVWGAEVIRRAVRGSDASTLSPRALAKLGLVLGLTLLATLANPETYRIYGYVQHLLSDPPSQAFVTEWQVPNIKERTDVLIFYGPFFLVMLVLTYARRRLSLTELGLFLVFAVFGLGAIRNGIWFTLISAPVLARRVEKLEVFDGLSDRGYISRLTEYLKRRPHTERRPRHGLNWAILIGLLGFTIVLSPWVKTQLSGGWVGPKLVQEGTPVGAADYMASHSLQGGTWHPQNYGDYLIWRLWPRQRSFIDGRVHLYDQSFVRDYLSTMQDDNWEARIAKYDIEYLLLPRDDESYANMIGDARTSEQWLLLYEDDVSVLFESVELPQDKRGRS